MPLFPHQEAAVNWLFGRGNCGLFDEQGLGKTASSILATKNARRTLVLCPAVVAYNWAREFKTWSPERRVQLVLKGRATVSTAAHVVVTTHGLLLKQGVREQLLNLGWAHLIVDEAHNFRTPRAQRTRLLYPLSRVGGSLSSSCDRTLLLTGTPMPNNPSELWTMLTLDPVRLHNDKGRPMSWQEWRTHFCKLAPSPYGDGWKVVGSRNVAELKQRLAGFYLRRLKKDVLDLPPVRFGHVALLGDKAPTCSVKGDGERAVEELMHSEHFSTWRRETGLAKVLPAGELLCEELAAEPMKKMVVFAHHREVVTSLSAQFAHAQLPFVTVLGSMTAEAKARAVDSFQNDPTTRVAICNIVAGGVGITLTAAHDVVFVEQSFIPGENAQAADRCHRIGQTRPVLVRFFSLANSIDEVVAEVLSRKTAMIREVM